MKRFTPWLYVLLFAALILHPHFITHIGPITAPYVASILNTIIVGIGIVIYYFNTREIEKKDAKIKSAAEQITEASAYIGSLNRRVPLFSNLSTSLISAQRQTKMQRKKIFSELLTTAVVTIAKVNWGLFRFVSSKNGKTKKEFAYVSDEDKLLSKHIPNGELILQSSPVSYYEGYTSVRTSDRNADMQAFLILPTVRKFDDGESLLLRAITDQAQLFYKYVFI